MLRVSRSHFTWILWVTELCCGLHSLTYSISVPFCSSLYSQFTVLPQLWVTFCLCIVGSFWTFHINKLVSFVSGFFTDQGVFELHLFSNTSVLLLNSIPLCAMKNKLILMCLPPPQNGVVVTVRLVFSPGLYMIFLLSLKVFSKIDTLNKHPVLPSLFY